MTITRINPDWQAKSSGSMLNGKLAYYKCGNVVHANFIGYQPGTITSRTVVGTMPAGYRPPNPASFVMTTNDVASTNMAFIDENGKVNIDAHASGKTLWGNITYPAWS